MNVSLAKNRFSFINFKVILKKSVAIQIFGSAYTFYFSMMSVHATELSFYYLTFDLQMIMLIKIKPH